MGKGSKAKESALNSLVRYPAILMTVRIVIRIDRGSQALMMKT